jgi:hypothetical protein
MGHWKLLGLIKALLDTGDAVSESVLKEMSFSSKLSMDPIYLAFLTDLIAQSLDSLSGDFVAEYILHCSIFHCDFLVGRLCELLKRLSEVQHSLRFECLLQRILLNQYLFSKKFSKLISTLQICSSHEASSPSGTSAMPNLDMLDIIFFSHASQRQRAVKLYAPEFKRLPLKQVNELFDLLTRCSSFTAQYIFLHGVCRNDKGKLRSFCQHSTFVDIRNGALELLLQQRRHKETKSLECLFRELSNDDGLLNPTHLEGTTNLMILEALPLEDFKDHFLSPFYIFLTDALCRIQSNISVICNGKLLASLTLCNKILRRTSVLDISYSVLDMLEKLVAELSFLVECQSPEGEEFDELFEIIDTDNKSKVIGHFAWKLIRELSLSYALLSVADAHLERAMNTTKGWLLKARHKGALSALQYPFQLTFACFVSKSSIDRTREVALDIFEECLHFESIDAARRSAGIPLVIQVMLAKVPCCVQSVLFDHMLGINVEPYSPEDAVHYANILRVIIKDAAFYDSVAEHIGRLLRIAFELIESKNWKVKNAASLLTGAVIQFVISECQTKRASPLLDFRILLSRFPSVAQVIFDNGVHEPAAHAPILALFKDLKFKDSDSAYLPSLVSFLQRQSASPNFLVRSLADAVLLRNEVAINTVSSISSHTQVSGFQKIMESDSLELLKEALHIYPHNYLILQRVLEFSKDANCEFVQDLCRQYLKLTVPANVRVIVVVYFSRWIERIKPPISVALLVQARFCASEEDSSLRDQFVRAWSGFRSLVPSRSPDYVVLCDIYSLVVSLCRSDLSSFIQRAFLERILSELEQNQQAPRALFAREPLNLHENVLLELELLSRHLNTPFDVCPNIRSRIELLMPATFGIGSLAEEWAPRCYRRLLQLHEANQ